MGCAGVGGWFYVLLSMLNVAVCLAFLAFAVECSVFRASPVELCYDSFLAYREVNKAMLGLLFGIEIVCCCLMLWLCRGVSVGPYRHVRRTLADPGARLYEAAMWSVTCAMVAYVWWALGSEGVYAMAALITTAVLLNTATTSYIAPVDLSERPSLLACASDHSGGGTCCDGTCRVDAASAHPYSDDEAFFDEYFPCSSAAAVAGFPPSASSSSLLPSSSSSSRRPRPGRMRTAAMRTLLLNLFLHNSVLFLYDITSVLARLDDTESSPVVRRALVLSNLASVWYRGGQALFFYFKYNFAWRNVMIPQFEAATIIPCEA